MELLFIQVSLSLKQHGHFPSRATHCAITFSLEPSSPTVPHKAIPGSHLLQWKAHLTLPLPSAGIAPSLHLPCLPGKEAKRPHKTQCDCNDKDQELLGKVTFQRPSTMHCTESSFCSQSEPELNAIGAVSRPLLRDDGTWQAG